jgi:hypothetical protein
VVGVDEASVVFCFLPSYTTNETLASGPLCALPIFPYALALDDAISTRHVFALLVLLSSSLLLELDVVVVAGVGSGHVEAVPMS